MSGELNTVSSSVPFQRIGFKDAETDRLGEIAAGRFSSRSVKKATIISLFIFTGVGLALLTYFLATHSPEKQHTQATGEIPWGGRNITGFPPSNYTT